MKHILRRSAFFRFVVIVLLLGLLFSCSDKNDDPEYSFNRAIQELLVLKECVDTNSTEDCYALEWGIPMDTVNLQRFHIWIDTNDVQYDTDEPSSEALENSIVVEFDPSLEKLYDTLDISSQISAFSDREEVLISIWPEYKSGDPVLIKNISIYLNDNIPPSTVILYTKSTDSSFNLNWQRPQDQEDYYSNDFFSGPIYGYYITIRVDGDSDCEEDLTDVKSTLTGDYNSDAIIYVDKKIGESDDGLLEVQSVEDFDCQIDLVILDGEGYIGNESDASDSIIDVNYLKNQFSLDVVGFSAETALKVTLRTFDVSGNYQSSDDELVKLTDDIKPLLAQRFYYEIDSDTNALLDSNRLIVFWNKALDPLEISNGITDGDTLIIPDNCNEGSCWRDIQYYNLLQEKNGELLEISSGGGHTDKYSKTYEQINVGDSIIFIESDSGSFVSDTIYYVIPGDSLNLRLVAIDSSGYASDTLFQSIFTMNSIYSEMECPKGWVAAWKSTLGSDADSISLSLPLSERGKFYCIEEYEHQDEEGFVSNVTWKDAREICQAMSGNGLTYDLCTADQWQGACEGDHPSSTEYGVIRRGDLSISDQLLGQCNAGGEDKEIAFDISLRSSSCVNSIGIFDMPGNLQEWVLDLKVELNDDGDTLSMDTIGFLKGTSYLSYDGADVENLTKCNVRSSAYNYRPAYTDSVAYLYKSGVSIDTLFAESEDSTSVLYEKLTVADFKDTLQFFTVRHPVSNEVLGEDYLNVKDINQRSTTVIDGDTLNYVDIISSGLIYEETTKKVVLISGNRIHEESANFYQKESIGFRCCAQ